MDSRLLYDLVRDLDDAYALLSIHEHNAKAVPKPDADYLVGMTILKDTTEQLRAAATKSEK